MADMSLTVKEKIVLSYLNRLMEANSRMIGEHVWSHGLRGGGTVGYVGGTICGNLRRRGLVTFLPELKAWRITREGLEMLKDVTQLD